MSPVAQSREQQVSRLSYTGPLTGLVSEGADLGTLVMVVQVNNKNVTYTLVENPSNLFELDSTSGELRTIGNVDRESLDPSGLLPVRIKASDGAGQSVEQLLTVVVKDVNDETPRFAQTEYFALIHENLPSGTPLSGLNILAVDRDSVSLTFRFFLFVYTTFCPVVSGRECHVRVGAGRFIRPV